MKTTDQRFRSLLKGAFLASHLEAKNDEVSNSVKTLMKRWPRLYNFLKKTVGPSYSPGNRYNFKGNIDELLGNTAHDKVVLNLGSGTYRIHPEIINVDIFPFKEVDIVADICNMPFKDGSVDGVVCEDVLEHIAHAPRLFKEMSRILKLGGTLILTVPFLYPYHSSPDDYFRWTEEGIRHVLKENNFNIEKLGVRGGPMGALQGLLMHVFATIFSFGSKTAYFLLVQFFMALFSPLKIFDLFFMLFPYSIEIASDIFIIARKNR